MEYIKPKFIICGLTKECFCIICIYIIFSYYMFCKAIGTFIFACLIFRLLYISFFF